MFLRYCNCKQRYHRKAKIANFLIKEGLNVKKLAEQYIEAAQQKEKVNLYNENHKNFKP
ncbi:hypothetical protein RGQ29_010724 [Quercus rubra]|uniref:Uncharacterized protein n=1 Tax=Quercus rubra TaxID=3512 RepID=A0AAN7J7N5_QUERU|nr:hypothetical protein RGQ29_010724 [Quercus rubra]KAK4601272.1 hypothetical protein RGQ29_010724 [Quercus rubra]